MTIALIIFGLSLLIMFLVILNKNRFLEKGSYLIDIKSDWDKKILYIFRHTVFFIKEFPRYTARRAGHFLVIKALEWFGKIKILIYPKISHIVDTVKGKDVPKMRGEVSEFLRSIKEEHRVRTERRHS